MTQWIPTATANWGAFLYFIGLILVSIAILLFMPIAVMRWLLRKGGTPWRTLPPGGKERVLIIGWNWLWVELILVAIFFKSVPVTLAFIAFFVLSDFAYDRYMRHKYPDAPIYRKKAHSE